MDKNLIDVTLNGEHVTHMNLDEFTRPNRCPDGSEDKFDIAYKNHPRKGFIGLQDHGSLCWFKNIKLRPLRVGIGLRKADFKCENSLILLGIQHFCETMFHSVFTLVC